MRLPNLNPLASALRKHVLSAARFIVRELLAQRTQIRADEQSPTRIDAPVSMVTSAPASVSAGKKLVAREACPPPHVPCKIYYPSRSRLSADQRRFYLYWRDQFARGNTIAADATYRYLYAYELAAELGTAEALDTVWSSLCLSYRSDAGFANYLARWIIDLRFAANRLVVDDVLALHQDPAVRLDVTLLVRATPSWQDVVDSVMSSEGGDRVAEFLADGYGQIATVAALASSLTPAMMHDTMFYGLPTRGEIGRLVKLSDERPSFAANAEFRIPVVALVASACRELGIRFTLANGAQFVVSGTAEVRVPIVRDVLPIRSYPPANTIGGLEATVRHALDDNARMLLAVVLASSERLPYVEGRVDAAKTLREPFEALAIACGSKVTLGHFRHAFFELGRGERAVWVIEPDVQEPNDIKMNQVVARFTKGLQHALYGTNARRAIIDATLDLLSKRCGRPKSALIDALATSCAATSSLLPNASEQVVA